MKKPLAPILTILLLCPIFAQAANSRVGTSGAQFLKVGAGPRSTAMGTAYVGLADDINAVYYNPAGTGQAKNTELIAMHTQLFQDIDYEFGAFMLPSQFGTFSISASTLKVSDQSKRGSDEALLGSFNTIDSAYALSYGHHVLGNYPNLFIGGTLRYIDQEIDVYEAKTWSADIGLLYQFRRLPFSAGLAARNFGQDIKFNNESDPQPFTVDLGFGTHLFRKKLILSTDIKSPRDNNIQTAIGAEWNQPLVADFKISARGGYTTEGTDADGTTGISLGGGIGFRLINIDFSWVPFGVLGDTFRYALHMKF